MMHRRGFLRRLAAASLGLRARDALAAPDAPPPSPEVHISYGQSDRSYEWPSFAAFGLDPMPEAMLALHVWAGPGGKSPGPLPAHGILPAVYARIDGITGYAGTDNITIGRCAVLAQQLLRRAAGEPAAPILEYCHAYPACNWTSCADPVGGLNPAGLPWKCGVVADNAIRLLVNTGRLSGARFRSVGYTQGGATPDTIEQKLADMTDMLVAYDGLALPGTRDRPLDFFITHQGAISAQTVLQPSFYGTVEFVRANHNRRTWGTTPIAPWEYVDGFHTSAYGMCRIGEFEGYAMYVVYDEGTGHFHPLWRSLTRPISVNGQIITVPFDRPSGRGFATGALQFSYDATDGLLQWPQQGFHVKRNGVDLDVAPSIGGLDVQLAVAQKLTRGDRLEVSYSYYGPGTTSKTRSGVGGNLTMPGPPSPLFPEKKINAWAWPFIEDVVVQV